MLYYRKLVGERLYLSPLNIEDAEKFTEWINDLEASLNLGNAHQVINLEDQKKFLEELNDKDYHFAIVEKSLDELLGSCGLFDINQIHSSGELGIFIGNKKYWDKGYGKEAVNLLLDFGFNILNLHNVMLTVYEYNPRAVKCYKKVGFKEIGRRREARLVGGERFAEIYMDILAEEFSASYILEKVNLSKD